MSSQGAHAQLAIDSSSPFSASSTALEFLEFDPGIDQTLIDLGDRAIRGTRSHSKERVAQGILKVEPTVLMQPSPTELDQLLTPILGGTESVDVFAVDEDVPARFLLFDAVAKVHEMGNVYVDKAIFRGQVNQPLMLELQFKGKTHTPRAAGYFTTVSVPAIDTDQVLVFHEGVLTLRSSARSFEQFVLVIDNDLEVNFYNSRTASDICAQDRKIMLGTSTPYTSSEIDLFDDPMTSAAGDSGTLVFTSGSKSTTFTFGNLKEMAKAPSVKSKREIKLPLQYKAYRSGATKEIEITHDPT
jgi:hypothetical protein